MNEIRPHRVKQLITKEFGRKLILSAPINKFQYIAEKATHFNKEKYSHIVSIMNNSMQISVISQLTILTLFNDKCVNCGKTFTHYALVYCLTEHNQIQKYNHKPLYNMIPVTIEKDEWGNLHYIPFTKDHIIPVSKFGENSLKNYQLMCEGCNVKKQNKLTNDDIKYGSYKKGIFSNIMNGSKVKILNFGNTEISSLEHHKGGLYYIEFKNNNIDGYYNINGENVLNKKIKIEGLKR